MGLMEERGGRLVGKDRVCCAVGGERLSGLEQEFGRVVAG